MARILYVITELGVGGAEKALFELATRLRDGFDPQVVSLTTEGPVGGMLIASGIPVRALGARGKADIRALWRLRRIIRESRPEIVHSFLFHANMAARLAAVGTGVAAVVCSARVAERARPRRRSLECRTHRLVDALVCVSTGVRDYYAAGGFPREKLLVIPNGVDVARFQGRDTSFKEKLGLAPEKPLITTIGRLHEQKGMSYFLRAAASLHHSRPGCHFLVVGAGPQDEELRTLARQLRIEPHVTFFGRCDDVAPVLKASDVFVLASLWEGMPNVVLEALAAGVPVVATRVEGVTDIIEDGRTGVLVMPRDVPAIVTAVARLLDEPERAARLAEAGRAHVAAHFPLEAMVERHAALYGDLLARAARAADP